MGLLEGSREGSRASQEEGEEGGLEVLGLNLYGPSSVT